MSAGPPLVLSSSSGRATAMAVRVSRFGTVRPLERLSGCAAGGALDRVASGNTRRTVNVCGSSDVEALRKKTPRRDPVIVVEERNTWRSADTTSAVARRLPRRAGVRADVTMSVERLLHAGC